jgi:hypothetical protein
MNLILWFCTLEHILKYLIVLLYSCYHQNLTRNVDGFVEGSYLYWTTFEQQVVQKG